MDGLENILSQGVVQRLGWTLIHFVWQAVAVALILSILLRLLRKSSANLRYIIACLSLAVLVLLPLVTMQSVKVSALRPAAMNPSGPEPLIRGTQIEGTGKMPLMQAPAQTENVTFAPRASLTDKLTGALEPALPHIVLGWLLGVFGLSIWHVGGWTQLQRLKRRMVKEVDAAWHSKLKELGQALGIRRSVQLMKSALVQVPTVVGWLKPAILLPASALTGLSAEQLEQILAHELAHIRRHDYLVNMLQTVVEILGFYHPAVWWVSHKIRQERENCCDDLAVSITGDRVRYVRALTSMEEIRAGQPELAVAATGGSLFDRIRHILGVGTTQTKSRFWVAGVTTVLLLLALTVSTGLALAVKNRGQGKKAKVEISAEELVAKIIDSEKKIRTAQAHVKWYEVDTGKLFKVFDWGYQADKEFIDGHEWSGEDKFEPIAKTKLAFDGKVQRSLRHRTGQEFANGGIGKFRPDAFSVPMTPKALLGYSITQGSRQTLGQVLSKANTVKVKKQAEQIQGRKCHVLEAIGVDDVDSLYDVRIWVDAERQYRPLQIEIFRSPDNKNYRNIEKRWSALWKRVTNIELREINGVWVPLKGDRYYFKQEKQEYHRRIELDSVRVNEGISPEKFTIKFPKGCDVYDEFTRERYIVGELSEQEAALSDAELIKQIENLSVEELIGIVRNIRRSRDLGMSRRKLFATIRRLVQIGSPVIPQLVEELNRTRIPQTESIIAFTLRAIGGPQAVPALIDALEKSGFCSDYGIGKAESDLEMFMKKHQMDPSKADLGLGRPVREITIALERLTGHSKGHDHFHAYDSQGKRLGSYTVTPEIRDRQRVHRKAAAEQWRSWWEQRQAARRHEGGILAAPEGSTLEFHIVPNLTEKDWPGLGAEDIKRYGGDLLENGPFPGAVRGDDYQWSRIAEGLLVPPGVVIQEHEGSNYVLLCERAQYVMRSEVEGRRVWGLEKVYAAQSTNGRPAIGFEFDKKGGELFHELTAANVGWSLAIVIDGKVVSAPTIQSALRKRGLIVGTFTQEEAESIVEALRKGMPPAGMPYTAEERTDTQRPNKENVREEPAKNLLRVYEVNRSVSDFPQENDFSTPEAAYAAINRVVRGDSPGWQRVSLKRLAKRFAAEQRRGKMKVEPEWSKVLLNARILEVRIWKGKYAMVMAELPQEFSSRKIRSPIDLRSLELEGGRWLNAGNARAWTVEEGRAIFKEAREYRDQEAKRELIRKGRIKEVIERPEEIKDAARKLFERIRTADYEHVLSYYSNGRWKKDGWKKLPAYGSYQVHTDWPSFALWVCRTFKDNPIISVELGQVFISDKEIIDKTGWPAVPYKLTLKDGSVLKGDLPFEYNFDGRKGHWHGMEGIDWHLQSTRELIQDERIKEVMDHPEEIKDAAHKLFESIRTADYEHVLSYYSNGRWKKDGWKKLLPSDKYYMTRMGFPSWVKWICETFKDNPIVSVGLGEVFVSNKEIYGLDNKTWPTVPYKLMLKDGGTIEGNLLFRYRPERKRSMFRTTEAYWQGMLGLDWHLQEEPIMKPNFKTDVQIKPGNNSQAPPLKAFERNLIEHVLDLVKQVEKKYPDRTTHWPAGPGLYHVDAQGQVTVWHYQLLWRRSTDCAEDEVGWGSSQLVNAKGMYYLPDGTPLQSRWRERGDGMKDIRVKVGRTVGENERVALIHRHRLPSDRDLLSRYGLKKTILLESWQGLPSAFIVRVDRPMRLDGWWLGDIETDTQYFDEYDQLIVNGPPGNNDWPMLVTVRLPEMHVQVEGEGRVDKQRDRSTKQKGRTPKNTLAYPGPQSPKPSND